MRHRHAAIAVVLSITLTSAGCHAPQPSADATPGPDAAAASSPDDVAAKGAVSAGFSQYLAGHGGGGEQFQADVVKVDGQPIQVAGAAGYRAFVTATILMPNGFRPECAPSSGRICMLYTGLKPTSEATTYHYDGNIEFTKSERGWIIAAININFDTPSSTWVGAVSPDGATESSTDNITGT